MQPDKYLKIEYPDTDHNSQYKSESGELVAMIKMVGSGIRVLKGIAKPLPYTLHYYTNNDEAIFFLADLLTMF